ncbi:cytochrome c [Fulvimarina pelagi HTCC2506]|uniref:Cytochrome c n=1 Tax=Fulvimarina pelagi HTCC2506 TaxID=314231 RepID=Q0G7Q9_9HYPH|nr:c-type cytochrome [Fulvimarina pelagi]EAU42305.1 cytochrome c [Fulvimarina pelagi HTCC2506]
MDSWQFNKIAGAVLGTIFLMFGGSLIAEGIFHSEAPETPGYEIIVAEGDEGGESGGEEATIAPIAVRMQEASAEDGEGRFRACQACHSVSDDGANGIGPGLWNVVNRPIASHEGFTYSQAMSGFSEGGSVNWDYEHLDGFLENPSAYIEGTAMGYQGIRDPADRADLIAYLRSLASEPAPLPEPPAEGEMAEGEAAEGEEVAEAETGEEGEEVEAAGAATQTSPSDTDTNTQAPGTTDPDTGSSMPGQDQAPVMSDETQPETRANEVQESTYGSENGEAAASEEETASEPSAGDDQNATANDAASGADESAGEEAETNAGGGEDAASGEEAASSDADSEEAAGAAPSEGASGGEVVEVAGDPAAGESVFRRCQACHKVGEGASNGIGPELNGVMGDKPGAVEGYSFSSNYQDWAADKEEWTAELMKGWLSDPRGTVQGTKMAFAGLKNEDDLNNVIAYLASFGEDGSQSGN